MSDHDLFIALILAAISSGREDPVGYAKIVLDHINKLETV